MVRLLRPALWIIFSTLINMKRITIRRKKSKAAPQPEPEPEQEEEQTSECSSEETVPETEPQPQPEEPVRNLKRREHPRQRQKVRFEAPDQNPRSASVARPQYFPQDPRRVNAYQQQKPPPYLNQPRSIDYPRPSNRTQGRQNMRYRSIYGPNAASMSTQDRARKLYFSCFG